MKEVASGGKHTKNTYRESAGKGLSARQVFVWLCNVPADRRLGRPGRPWRKFGNRDRVGADFCEDDHGGSRLEAGSCSAGGVEDGKSSVVRGVEKRLWGSQDLRPREGGSDAGRRRRPPAFR